MLGLCCCCHWNLSQHDLSPGLFQVPWEVFLLPLLKVKVKSLSRVRLFAIPWTVFYQASLSMGFSRQEYWTGLPFPSPRALPDPGIKPRSPALQADTLPSEPPPYNSFSTFQPWWTFKKANQIMLPSCSIIHALPKHLKSKLLPMAYMVLCDLIPAYPFDFIPYHSLLFSLHSAHISPTSISWFHHSQKKKKYLLVVCLPCWTVLSVRAGTFPISFSWKKEWIQHQCTVSTKPSLYFSEGNMLSFSLNFVSTSLLTFTTSHLML